MTIDVGPNLTFILTLLVSAWALVAIIGAFSVMRAAQKIGGKF